MYHEKGIALITALLFLLILSLSWFTFAFFTSDEAGVIQNQIDSAQAAYLAEAGIQQALWGLSGHPDWKNDTWWVTQFGGARGLDRGKNFYEWNGNLGDSGQNYIVRIIESGIIKDNLVSTGTVTPSSWKIEVEMASPFDCALFSGDDIGVQILSLLGNLHLNQGINLPISPSVSDKLSMSITQDIGRSYIYLPKGIKMPELDLSRFEAKWNEFNEAMEIRDAASYVTDGSATISANPSADTEYTHTPNVQFVNNIKFENNIKVAGNAVFGKSSGSTTIERDVSVLVKCNAYFFNKVKIEGNLYIAGSLYFFESSTYRSPFDPSSYDYWKAIFNVVDCNDDGLSDFDDNGNGEIDNAEVETYVDENSFGSHSITLDSGGSLFVKNGIFVINENVSTGMGGKIEIKDFCYVNGNVTINNTQQDFISDIPTTLENQAFFIRDGSLTVTKNMKGKGKVVVARDITINDRLLSKGADGLYLIAGEDVKIQNSVGNLSPRQPFRGLVYAGGTLTGGTTSSYFYVMNGIVAAGDLLDDTNPNRLDWIYVSYDATIRNTIFQNPRAFGFGTALTNPVLWREAN